MSAERMPMDCKTRVDVTIGPDPGIEAAATDDSVDAKLKKEIQLFYLNKRKIFTTTTKIF